MKTSAIKKTLKQFRKDREEVLEATTNEEWRKFITSPYFWFYWSMGNISSNDIEQVATWVLSKDTKDEFYDISDTIKAVYIDPIKWIQNTDFNLKTMIEKHGQPM